MLKIGSFNPRRVKRMIYKIDTCCFLAWCSTLIGYDKGLLAQCQVTGKGWDLRHDFPVGQHYKGHLECVLSQVGACPEMTLEIVKI